MSESILRNKSKEFAKQTVILCRDIKALHHEAVLTNQLLRSGNSIGANIREAQYAHGKPDFIAKMQIALKKQMKRVTGLNYFIKPIISTRKLTNPSILPVQVFALCSSPLSIRRKQI